MNSIDPTKPAAEETFCITVCAWCQPAQILSVVHVPAGSPTAGKISHGICQFCLERQIQLLQCIQTQTSSSQL